MCPFSRSRKNEPGAVQRSRRNQKHWKIKGFAKRISLSVEDGPRHLGLKKPSLEKCAFLLSRNIELTSNQCLSFRICDNCKPNICVHEQHTSLENGLQMKCASFKVDKPTKTDFKTDFLIRDPSAHSLGLNCVHTFGLNHVTCCLHF